MIHNAVVPVWCHNCDDIITSPTDCLLSVTLPAAVLAENMLWLLLLHQIDRILPNYSNEDIHKMHLDYYFVTKIHFLCTLRHLQAPASVLIIV